VKIWVVVLLLGVSAVAAAFGPDDILIADFEGDDYGGWVAAGEAFGPGPARGTLPNQMEVSGYLGRGLVNTYYKGDDTTGTLTSPLFTIQRRYINFLIGGGMHPEQACINLLVADQVVRTATGPNDRPGGSERLSWSCWDVSELMGEEARIQIVDERTGGWGHINIDHIFQSDRKIEPVDLTREILLDKRYMNLPVRTGAPKVYLDVVIDGRIVRDFDVELAVNEPQFWVFLDMAQFTGRTATLKLHDSFGMDPNLLKVITLDDRIRGLEGLYREKHRPQFHFTSRRGWNNDSNGMVFYKGEYHLFYQHNPYGWAWGNMTWGHAVSRDLVHWEELGDALHPDHLGTIYSGSAVIDWNNTSGFQTGDEKPLVCFYTSAGGENRASRGHPYTQSIAYSNDRGRTFTKYPGNPVIGHIHGGNRDPKVLWHEPTSRWVMVLYLDDHEMGFFTSADLKQWEMTSRLKCFHECPELFELPVDGNEANRLWVLYGASGDYLLGDFDGRQFTPRTQAIKFSYGNCFYASQTFSDIPPSDGRRIQIGWARVDTPGMPFNQSMTFPVELTLRTTEQGVRMFAQPVRELRRLDAGGYTWGEVAIRPGQNLLDKVEGELFHIVAEFTTGAAEQFGLVVRGTAITYDTQKRQLQCRDKTADLAPVDGRIRLEILVDRTIIEIFANDGRIYMPMGGILPEGNRRLEVFTKPGETVVHSLVVNELESIWPQ